MKGKRRFQSIVDNNGSALILVLWSLTLIGFLAGEYLDYNRTKASLAANAWNSLRQRQAVLSVLSLVSTDYQAIPDQIKKKGDWACFSSEGIDLWVKVETEANKIDINTASETLIREQILKILGGHQTDAADQLAAAILDWRDEDSLVRNDGAEEGFYKAAGLTYGPANGPIKVLTEILLIKGMTRDMFWGNPMRNLFRKKAGDAVVTDISVLESFTIYNQDVKRVTMMVPGKQNSYALVVAFLANQNGQWDILQVYQNILVSPGKENQYTDEGESIIESL